jgi:hypothetical protein
MIQGTTITLINKTRSGTDPFNAPIYSETQTEVENVLVAQPSASQVIDQMNLYGKRLAYTLGIPKGDTHIWKEQDVIIFGERFHVFTEVTKGIEENVPGPWHHTYGVERYG